MLEPVDQPADVLVGVLREPGVGLHEPRGHPAGRRVELVPVRHAVGPGRELGVRRHDPELLLARERVLALGVPPVVEGAGVALDPLRRHVEGRVRRTEREVAEERLVRRQLVLRGDPVDRVVHEVLGEVVAVLGQSVRLDGRGAVVELGVPVVHLGTHEAVEPVEALPGRPTCERPGGVHLHRRGLVPLAERRCAPAVAGQHLGDRRGAGGPVAGVAGLVGRHLGGDAHADGVVVAPGHQRLPGRRAQCGDVETAVAQSALRQPLRGRHPARTAVRAAGTEAHVVDHHDEHVGRAVRRPGGPHRALAYVDREAGAVGLGHRHIVGRGATVTRRGVPVAPGSARRSPAPGGWRAR